MPAAKKQYKKRAYKKRTYKPKVYRKPAMSQPDVASLTCTANLSDPTMNTMYSILDTSLDQYQRAVTVASAYQFYRITQISVKFKPRLDTYIAGGAGTVPYLYTMIDRAGAIPTNIGIAELLQMGAKPRRFDDKTLTVKWRPSVLTDVAIAPGGASTSSAPQQYKISPWLTTNATATSPGAWTPSTVDHLGLYYYVETSGTLSLFDVEVTVDFQFKKPLININPENPVAVKSTLQN